MKPRVLHTTGPREIAALHREALAALGREYTLAEIMERWSSVADVAFVIVSLDTPTGFISYRRTAPTGCYISDLYIRPACRGRGHARLLIGALKARFRPVTLRVYPGNIGAVRLYLSEGFREREAADAAGRVGMIYEPN